MHVHSSAHGSTLFQRQDAKKKLNRSPFSGFSPLRQGIPWFLRVSDVFQVPAAIRELV
jgi:hypothetical protein